MKKFVFIAFIVGALYSCTNDVKETTEYISPTITHTSTADSITTVASVNKLHSFLQDYKTNYKDINSKPFIIGKAEKTHVDFNKLITYQESLKKSGYFTMRYFEEKVIYYTELDSRLASATTYDNNEVKQDPILFVVDHQKILNNLSNITYTANQTQSGVIINGTYNDIVVTAELFFENDTWVINNIYCYFK